MMKAWMTTLYHTFFDSRLDLRVRVFRILASAAIVGTMIISLVNFFSGVSLSSVLVNVISGLLSAALLYYSYRTQRYQQCYLITITVIFIGLFSYFFLHLGGYHGGMPMFFVFALVYTAFMLEGRRVIVVMALELVIYTGLLYYAYTNPAGVVFFPEERGFFISNLLDVWVVGIVLSATMYAQMRLYRNQQRRVDEQNAVLEQANYAKTQFLANTSHEMRTPLTVISVNIQTVQGLLKRVDGLSDDREVQELLQDAQAEIMRLSRMVGGMLSINALAEGTEKTKTDFTAVLNNTGDMMRLLLDKKKNRLSLDLAPDLIVFGNADLLSQVVINLLQNANTHTEAGNIRVEAKDHEGEIRVLVTDEGKGISAQILPHVFERGVSEGGTGVGLFLCKAVVESHGGRIAIESTEGEGTLVTFTIPSYQGQFGGEDHV